MGRLSVYTVFNKSETEVIVDLRYGDLCAPSLGMNKSESYER